MKLYDVKKNDEMLIHKLMLQKHDQQIIVVMKRRNLVLFNYQKVWDMSWNMHEWVNWGNTLDWTDLIVNWDPCSWDNNELEWSDCNYSNWYSKGKNWPLLDIGVINWAWKIDPDSSLSSSVVLRRWYAADAYDWTSIYTLFLNYDIADKWTHVGFRCAYIK